MSHYLLRQHEDALADLYHHVGFKDAVIFPVHDLTEYEWNIVGEWVVWGLADDGPERAYEGRIYTQHPYDKHVWPGRDLTMISVDTGVGMMMYFAFFDNAKRVGAEPAPEPKTDTGPTKIEDVVRALTNQEIRQGYKDFWAHLNNSEPGSFGAKFYTHVLTLLHEEVLRRFWS